MTSGTRMRAGTAVLSAAVMVAVPFIGAMPATAAEDGRAIAAVINAAEPDFLDGASGRGVAASKLPDHAREAIRVGSNGIGLALASSAGLGGPVSVAENAVAFPGGDTTQVVADKGNGLIGMATIIEAAGAGERFTYAVSAGSGVTAEIGELNGGVLFLDGGTVVGGVMPPWATDANGAEVPTHYEVVEGAIVQVVDHVGEGFAYPIVADPTYYGESLIDYVTGVSSPWTSHVYTTSWFRTNINLGNSIVRTQVTDEYIRIVPSSFDTTGARQQVSCHAWWAALKVPWNIELWRPTVGEAATVAAQCNPT